MPKSKFYGIDLLFQGREGIDKIDILYFSILCFQTQKMYKWIEPKICREDLEGAVQLPASGTKEACPPCNPGMEPYNNTCRFCKPGDFSETGQQCQTCPSSTAPEYGLELKWWNNLPLEANISTSCLSMNGNNVFLVFHSRYLMNTYLSPVLSYY